MDLRFKELVSLGVDEAGEVGGGDWVIEDVVSLKVLIPINWLINPRIFM